MKKTGKHIPDMEQFKDMLKGAGLKATSQRLAVHDAMMALGHASADMVAEYICKNSRTSVAVASVYNTLSGLADLRIYSRRLSCSNKMFFDVNATKHIHLYDTKFNEYMDIPDKDVLALIESKSKGRKFKGYKLDGIDVQIICHSTRRNLRKEDL